MQIIIDDYGIELAISNNRLAVRKGETEKLLTPSRVSAIHIFAPCHLTTPVIEWAVENNASLLIYNRKGRVKARLWHPAFGSHAAIRIQQLVFCRSADGLLWVKDLLIKKANAQLSTQKALPPQLQQRKMQERINRLIAQMSIQETADPVWLRAMEASISRWYWAALAMALKNHLPMDLRSIRPARDAFNAILNYLYGTLYGLVEGSLIAAGLDPQISIMHRMQYNTPAFAFDVIEPFRHWADNFLIQLVLQDELQPAFTEKTGEKVLLTGAGKKFILTRWFAWLQEKTPAPRRLIRRKDQVQQLCTSLAAQLLKTYKEQNRQL